MEQILGTERLILRHFNVQDTAFIIQLLNSPGWIMFIGDRNVHTDEDATKYLLNGPMKSYEVNGYGLSMVELKNDKTPIGMCGIIKREGLEHPDIGFAFLPEFIGKGYGYEIASATMVYARDTLKLPCISAITVPSNNASINLVKKIGLQFKKEFSFPDSEEVLLLFSNG